MRHIIITAGLSLLLASAGHAQSPTPNFIPGKLAVLRGGDGIITIASGRQHPIFIDEYDTVTNNQASPAMSLELPTNGPNGIFMNAHAGSEGQGLTRSADRRYLVVSGYCGDLNSIPGTPSSATNNSGQGYGRGFGTIDAFTNFNVNYQSPEWFGLQPGITQNNPRGIATDGTNSFWGCGTVAGTQSGGFTETGTLFWDGGPDPEIVQNSVSSAYFMKIINGVLYMLCESETGGAEYNGIYNFQQYNFAGGAPVPLPWDPNVPNPVETVVTTNLFLNAGTAYSKIKTFDMNLAGTIAYVADNTLGIAKFVNSAGTWTSPYFFNSNNIGSGVGFSARNPKSATGCYGIAVDFSGANPIIYATTMDEGDGANTCSNRLISIVDTGTAPDPTAVLATTLAVANGTNEVFRGVDFTPDLRPLITSQPVGASLLTSETMNFSVGTQSPFPLTFQWQINGTNLADGSTISGSATAAMTLSPLVVTNSGNYTVIVSNQYGAVTSVVANLVVSSTPIPPSVTNTVEYVTNFIGNNQAFSVSPTGTQPFVYQWYFGATQLVDDGVTYSGSTNSTLYVTNLQLSNSGNYYVTVSNQATSGYSNLFAVLTVQYVLPSIGAGGEPIPTTILQGQTTSLSVSASGTLPLSYQWYQVLGKNTNVLNNTGEFSGVQTSTLTITGASLSDGTNYVCIVTNGGGSAATSKTLVTVLLAPALSYVAYSNQVYTQNFNSLPNPGNTPVNTVGGGGFTTIGGITYNIGNPFDFAYPLYTNLTGTPAGGLGLTTTMPGWYGECDGDTGGAQLGAADGSTTTGGIYSFGTTTGITQNRALGLIATSTSGATHFGLKLINETANNLNYIGLQFTGEFWKTGAKPKVMQFSYAVDPAGNNSTLSSSEILASSNNPVSNLTFSFSPPGVVGPTNGTLPDNQTNLSVTNLALSSAWTPGSALWLIWSINDPTGSGEGYGIDNLSFAASSTADVSLYIPVTPPALMSTVYSTNSGLTFSFTNAPGASAEFTVRATTNLTAPLSDWVSLGYPTEVSSGHYEFDDTEATNYTQTFYTVTSP